MLLNYVSTGLRNLTRHKSYAVTNILCFSFALVPLTLAMVYIAYELSYDKFNANYDRIVRVVMNESPIVPNPLAQALKDEFPEIKCAARLRTLSEEVSYRNVQFEERNILYADPDVFRIFSFTFLRGDPSTVFPDQFSIALSESMARKYFGDGNPIGRLMTIRKYLDVKVTAIYKDLPDNSHFQASAVVPASILDGSSMGAGLPAGRNAWGMSSFCTYLLLAPDANRESLPTKFHFVMAKYSGIQGIYADFVFWLQPLSDIHLRSHLESELGQNGSPERIYLYMSLAIIIFVVTVLNYVILSTAQYTRRLKEIAVRKVVGGSSAQLMMQLLTETALVTLFAMAVSIAVVHFTLPFFNALVEREIHFNPLTDPIDFVRTLMLFLIFTVSSGLYPAYILASIEPLAFFSGRVRGLTSSVFRRFLVGLQFVIALGLIFSAMIIKEQNDYITQKDLGYARDNIIVFYLRHGEQPNQLARLKNEMLANSNVIAVSSSINLPNETFCGSGVSWSGSEPQSGLKANFNFVDPDFFDVYQIKVVRGRLFRKDDVADQSNSVVISEMAAHRIGWDRAIGMQLRFGSPDGVQTRTVIGIVNDFHMHNLHSPITPFCFIVDPEITHSCLSIKINPNVRAETVEYLERTMKGYRSDYASNHQDFGDIVSSSYRSETRLESLISVFSGLAIAVASLGLLSMISFMTVMRQREIAIRKVLGATATEIGMTLIREMTTVIGLATILAFPLAWFGVKKWLSSFAYVVQINFALLLLGAIIVCVLSIAVVFLQVRNAALKNPIDALRHE